jgi:hypothetical protein
MDRKPVAQCCKERLVSFEKAPTLLGAVGVYRIGGTFDN